MRHARTAFAALTIVLLVAGIRAQQPGFSRTVVQRGDLSTPNHEVVTAVAEFQAGATVGMHTHPGEEVGYVLEGTILLEQQGKPAVTLKAGEGFIIPSATAHNATNKGTGRARVLANYIVEKGKPLATPVK
jgi:quercetin dioxygenase-like cupin family protein